MKPDPKLLELKKISDLIFERRLVALKATAAARNESLQRLQDLAPQESKDALEPLAQAQAQLRYEAWADARRADINLLLARQTAEWIEARKIAKTAFGRAGILRGLSKQQ